MITVGELKDWLNEFEDDAKIGVDEGGLTLEVKDPDECLEDDEPIESLEIGGWPLDEEDDE